MFDPWAIVANLPHVDDYQDFTSRISAEGDTFVPSLQPTFAKHFFPLNYKTPSNDEIINSLLVWSQNLPLQSPDLNDVENFVSIISSSESPVHLTVNLLYIYTRQSFFYSEINKALRTDKETISLIVPIIRGMMNGSGSRPYHGYLYRGFKCSGSELNVYNAGLVFTWPGFTSCSIDKNVAESFAGDNGLIFKIKIQKEVSHLVATDISSISCFRKEKEVLLNPYTWFMVDSVEDQIIHCSVVSGVEQLTGVWTCKEDHGIYYVSQTGNSICWFAHSREKFSWAHVFFGTLQGNKLTGTFGDVPVHRDRFKGNITCEISNDSFTMKQTSSGVFMGQTWKKERHHLQKSDWPTLNHTPVSGDYGLTGCWRSDKGLIYFISNYGSEIFWFAYAPNWVCANIGKGKETEKNTWNVVYADVILSTRFRYYGEIMLTLQSGFLIIQKLRGPYGCTKLQRIN